LNRVPSPSVSVVVLTVSNAPYASVVVVTWPDRPAGPVVTACTLVTGRPSESLVTIDMLPSAFVDVT
jgi:hypothetical protein